MSATERRERIRLARCENVGPITFLRMIEKFGSAQSALEALPELSRRGGLERTIKVPDIAKIEDEMARTEALGAHYAVWGDEGYPELLRHIDDPPPALCLKGDVALLDTTGIGIVGARNASAPGRRFARTLASDLGHAGYVIVSGLARGIDTAAHEAALETGTVAVLACGIDVIYPPENDRLHREIGERGLLVTEMAPGIEPKGKLFPRRNRIIAGLSRGIVVVEAARRSGTLITARLALEQGREVFAVPGSPLDPRAEGTNGLIAKGAHLTTSARDVSDVIAPMLADRVTPPRPAGGLAEPVTPAHGDIEDGDRATVTGLIGASATDIDDLIRESGLKPAIVHTVILELELAGRLVRQDGHTVAMTQ